jgi:hypothetical protein
VVLFATFLVLGILFLLFSLPFKLSQDPAHRILAMVFAQAMLTMITSRVRRTVSFFWYLKVFGQVLKTSPKDVHPQVAMALVGEKYNMAHVFYMDLMANLNATFHHPGPRGHRLYKAQTKKNHPKHSLGKDFSWNMTGEKPIVTSEGGRLDAAPFNARSSPFFPLITFPSILPDVVDHVLCSKERHSQFFPMQNFFASNQMIDIDQPHDAGQQLEQLQNTEHDFPPSPPGLQKFDKAIFPGPHIQHG